MLLLFIFLSGCSQAETVPQASIFDGDMGGCGDVLVYRFNEDRTMAVRVVVPTFRIPEGAEEQVVHIIPSNEYLGVEVYQWDRPVGEYFCNDVDIDHDPITTWESLSGTITVIRLPNESSEDVGSAYPVSIIAENIELKNKQSGQTTKIEQIRFESVLVGWYQG